MSSFNISRRRGNKRAGQWLYRTGRLNAPGVQARVSKMTNWQRHQWAKCGHDLSMIDSSLQLKPEDVR